MTNRTLSTLLEYLCNETRKAVHVALGAVDLSRASSRGGRSLPPALPNRPNLDSVLNCLDDLRSILSDPGTAQVLDCFDLSDCIGDVIEVLNLSPGDAGRRLILDSAAEPLLIHQEKQGLEQILIRVMRAAQRLSRAPEVHVTVANSGTLAACMLAAHDPELASRIAGWLNANLDEVDLRDVAELPLAIATIVAGNRVRSLGGSAEVARDAFGRACIRLNIRKVQDRLALPPDMGVFDPAPLRILLAEDTDENFALSSALLKNERVLRALDGAEALRHVQAQRLDLILMDIHLPGMDGYSAIRRIRDWETETGNARTPIVILASDDTDAQSGPAASCGCSGFLRKPLHPADLSSLIEPLKKIQTPPALYLPAMPVRSLGLH